MSTTPTGSRASDAAHGPTTTRRRRVLAAVVATVVGAAGSLPWAFATAVPAGADEPLIGVPFPATYFTGSMETEPAPGPCGPEGQPVVGPMCVESDGLTITLSDATVFVGEAITATASTSATGEVIWVPSSPIVSGCRDGDTTCTFVPYATGPAWRKVGAAVRNTGTSGPFLLASGEAAYSVDAHLVEGDVLIEDLTPPPYLTEPFPWPTTALRLVRTDALGDPTPYLYNGLYSENFALVDVPQSFAEQGFCYFCGGSTDLNGKAGLEYGTGRFRAFVPEGWYTLYVTRYPYYGEPNSMTQLPGWGAPITFFVGADTEIHLRRDLKPIEGTVRAPDGRGLAGVPILARALGPTPGALASTDASGHFEMMVERGSYELLTPGDRGRFVPATRMVDVSQDDATGQDFVQETARIEGWLFSDDDVVADWPVEAVGPTRHEVRSDESGHFVFEIEPAFWAVQPVGGVWDPPNEGVQLGSAPQQASFTCVGAEQCTPVRLALTFESGPDRLDVDEAAPFMFTLANRTDQFITGVTVTGPTGVLGTGAVGSAGPDPEPPAELAPGAEVPLTYVLTGAQAGHGRYRWAATGDADGEPLEASVVRELRVGTPFTVQVIPAAPEVVLGVTFPDNVYGVTVAVTNDSDEVLENVHVVGSVPISVGPVAPGDPHSNSAMAMDRPDPDGDGPLEAFDAPEQPDGFMGDIDPGTTGLLTYYLEALYPGTSALEALVSGGTGGLTVTDTGKGTVKVIEDVLVEVGVKVEQLPNFAGQVVRLGGVVRNVSADRRITLSAYPVVDGNAGNGYLTTGGVTPKMAEAWTLDPGQSKEVSGVLVTAPTPAATDAKVEYVVFAFAEEDDGTRTDVSAQVRILDDDTYDHPVVARVPPGEPELDEKFETCGTNAWYWLAWCGFEVGGGSLVYGLADIAAMGWSAMKTGGEYFVRLHAWQLRMLETGLRALAGDPVAQQAVIDEVALDLTAALQAFIVEPPPEKTWAQVAYEVAYAASGSLGTWATEVATTGDLEELTFQLGRQLGENADMLAEGGIGVVTRMARRSLLVKVSKGFAQASPDPTVRAALERQAANQQTSLASRVAGAEEAGTDLNKAVKAGDDLEAVPGLLRKGWGVTDDVIAALKKLADAEGILIAFRSRSAKAIDLLERGVAYAKRPPMYAKNLDDTDRLLFGSTDRLTDATVVVAKPPSSHFGDVDWSLPDGPLDEVLEEAATRWVDDTLAITDPVERSRAIARAHQRAGEFAKHRELLWEGGDVTKPGPLQVEGVDTAFKLDTQGIPVDVGKDVRRFSVDEPVAANGWDVYTVRMEGPKLPDGSRVDPKLITQDTDVLAILNLDGTLITDPDKRIRIYKRMQQIAGMQHGESATYFELQKRAEYLRCCVEAGQAMAVVDPTSVRAAHFVEHSITPDTLNAPFVGTFAHGAGGHVAFVLLDGARPLAYASRSHYVAVTLPSLLSQLSDLTSWYVLSLTRRVFSAINSMDQRVDGMRPDQSSDHFNRSAPVIQPDGTGGLERFVPGVEGAAVQGAGVLAAGVGGSHWEPVTLDEALAYGEPGILDTAPVTVLVAEAPAGATRLEVATLADFGLPDGPFFEPGDRVVIDPGGPGELAATVTALGSLVLDRPLPTSYPIGTMVVYAPEPAPPAPVFPLLVSARQSRIGAAPLDGARLGRIAFIHLAADPAIASVRFQLDNGRLVTVDRSAPWNFLELLGVTLPLWTRLLRTGPHTLAATVTTTTGATVTSTATFTVAR